jgi:hypothetical protein
MRRQAFYHRANCATMMNDDSAQNFLNVCMCISVGCILLHTALERAVSKGLWFFCIVSARIHLFERN